jgi:hypothetical protein
MAGEVVLNLSLEQATNWMCEWVSARDGKSDLKSSARKVQNMVRGKRGKKFSQAVAGIRVLGCGGRQRCGRVGEPKFEFECLGSFKVASAQGDKEKRPQQPVMQHE